MKPEEAMQAESSGRAKLSTTLEAAYEAHAKAVAKANETLQAAVKAADEVFDGELSSITSKSVARAESEDRARVAAYNAEAGLDPSGKPLPADNGKGGGKGDGKPKRRDG